MDGTLGAASALAGPNFAITSSLGRQFGANLFHRFSTFNIANGQSATFYGPGSVSNIIGGVTGGSASNTDGVLASTITGANLYLINPRGMLFGPNASLDLTGSIHAASADSIKLDNGGRFDAANPAISVLTAAPPAAFGFLGPTGWPITLQGSQLSVPEGASIALVGGPVDMTDASVRTVAGDIRLVAMGRAGEIPLDAAAASLPGIPLAPILIARSSLTTESVPRAAPGRIVIRGGQIRVVDSTISLRPIPLSRRPPNSAFRATCRSPRRARTRGRRWRACRRRCSTLPGCCAIPEPGVPGHGRAARWASVAQAWRPRRPDIRAASTLRAQVCQR